MPYFLAGQFHPCPFMDCLLFCKGSRCLTTDVWAQIVHWTSLWAGENETKHCKSVDTTHIHRLLSLLQSWWEGITLGALVRCCIQAAHATEQLCNAFCSHQQCQGRRQGPSMPGNWGAYSISLCLPWSCNGLERDWGGLWCSGKRQEGTVFLSGNVAVTSKEGKDRE